jgi:NDP-sugar pyrophosphorylase family protein
MAYCGIRVLSNRIFPFLEQESGVFSIIRSYMKAAASGERISYVDIGENYWIDVGTQEALARLESHLRGNG